MVPPSIAMPDEENDDWEQRYAAAKGIAKPTSTCKGSYTAAETAFWEKKRELVKKSGCEVGYHCSGDCPMPYVAVSASEVTSHRGSMKEIKSLDVKPEWDSLLADFCEKLGIKTEGLKPSWWLVSYWG